MTAAWTLEPGELDALVAFRRDIHQHPELAFQETRTAGRIAEFLEGLGLTPMREVGRTGVVAVLDTGRPGRTVGIRTDMDALPMEETSGLPFRSMAGRIAHTCGHDVHSTIGLGAAVLLARHKDALNGRFKFIFQPAEETLQGALAMIDAGVLKNPNVDVMLGCHNSPQLPTGQVAYRHGAVMASSSALVITVRGVAGHAAHPTSGVDALQAVPLLLQAINTIRCKETPPAQPLILSIGKIAGGRARNVICDEVVMEGTCRTFDGELTASVEASLRRMAQGIGAATRTTIEVDWRNLAPVLSNDSPALDSVLAGVREALGNEAVVELDVPSTGSEDFAWYGQHVPIVQLRIGSRSAGKSVQLHQTDYVCNEGAIPVGAMAMASGAARLAQQAQRG